MPTLDLTIAHEDQMLQAAVEYKYVSEQLERAARFLRQRRLTQAEAAVRFAIAGLDRAEAAFERDE